MKNILIKLMSVMFVFTLMVGCSTNEDTNQNSKESQTENQQTEKVVITISKNHGEETIKEEEVNFSEGDALLDVLKENFAVEESDGFITSIEGIEQDVDKKMGWIYFINDEMAMVGAADYQLEADDKITFDLQAWE